MSNVNEVQFYEDGVPLSEKQKAEISEGVVWTRNWITARHKNGSFLDYDALGVEQPDESEYSSALNRSQNVQVVSTTDFYESLEKGLAEGRLHLSPSVIEQFGGEQEALFALQIVNANKRSTLDPNQVAMSVSKYIDEPVIFINPVIYEKLCKDDSSTPSLSSVIAHETTHVLNMKISEEMTKAVFQNSLNDGVSFDKYLDSEPEIYARIMQLRHDFELKPQHEFSIEEIQELRVKSQKASENGSNKADYHIFDRYSDKQVQDWLNYTSEIKKNTPKIDRDVLRESMRSDADVAWTESGLVKYGQKFLDEYYETHPKAKDFLKAARDKVKDVASVPVDYIKNKYSSRS